MLEQIKDRLVAGLRAVVTDERVAMPPNTS